jgi:hypothetical protein
MFIAVWHLSRYFTGTSVLSSQLDYILSRNVYFSELKQRSIYIHNISPVSYGAPISEPWFSHFKISPLFYIIKNMVVISCVILQTSNNSFCPYN